MIIDCDDCAVRGPACGDCVVTVLLGGRPDSAVTAEDTVDRLHLNGVHLNSIDLDDTERRAVEALAAGGLIPPLRMVPLLSVISTESKQNVTQGRRSAG